MRAEMSQRDRAAQLRELHACRPLVLPNAWDVGSARIIERAGAQALATTSAGVSWALGQSDGERIARDEMLDTVRRIVRAVRIPVTADVESGYGDGSPAAVAETVRALVAIGAAGMNLEDTPGRNGSPLLSAEEHAARLRAAREAARAAGGDLVINARVDVFLFEVGPPETRLQETVRRAQAYRAAGADCIFVPGVSDAETIASLVRAIEAPLNVMAVPGTPTTAELGRLGVARVSVGPSIAQAALAATQKAARELLDRGTCGVSTELLAFRDANGMFAAQ
jgi:2-methylisocitrate lyase-like PEP mutase family enzyme